MGVFLAVLILIIAVNIFGPPPEGGKVVLAASAVFAYFLAAAGAFWLDRKRR